MSAPLYATQQASIQQYQIQQYTEAECILIKQQVADYKRRLGSNSGLYLQSKTSFDKHCQHPVRKTVRLSQPSSNRIAKAEFVAKENHVASAFLPTKDTDLAGQRTEPPSPFTLMFKPLLIMLLLAFLGSLALAYFKKKLPQIKGRIGENLVIKGLEKHLDRDEYTIINDVTLPLEDGGTTQVDHVVVSRFGIFIIETKNMSGWIFGNEKQAKWTQTIHRSKHQFQNPLRQNYKHTKTLSDLLDLPHELFHSVVVFTRNAELKTKFPENVGHLDEMVSYIKAFNEEIINYKLKIKVVKHVGVVKLKQGRKTDKQHVDYLNEKHSGSLHS
ncbi:NERD domain-containing protein [Thalassotalea euphylliae]|uniref:NERD domain-containing protein n=1 Tax=Thalassotalea euphylliae TaxID=1655234 RepID=A0A3E0U1R2_9GAMM|nr:NERD domain-containing protein [Thalassotalea euphylliae]